MNVLFLLIVVAYALVLGLTCTKFKPNRNGMKALRVFVPTIGLSIIVIGFLSLN